MTDKELLELAAKAIFPECVALTYPLVWVHDYIGNWNPLNDDGDALRLAMKLKMVVDTGTDDGKSFAANSEMQDGMPDEVKHDNDPYKATRRAIVRAAAEIGRTK